MIDNTENSQRKNKIEDTEQSACTLCPRDCKKNRADGEIGVCGETAAMRIGRAALYMWEEPCISGEKGSGAVFFTGCPLHCVYCQNYAISDGGTGRQITVEALVQIFRDLEAQARRISIWSLRIILSRRWHRQSDRRRTKDFPCHLSITQAVMSGWKLCVC